MGDSDEEYNRRRGGRDKFMKERSDFQDKRRGDFGGATGGAGGGADRRTYGGGGQNRVDYKQPFRGSTGVAGRPDASPPMKRMRREWDDMGYEPSSRRDLGDLPPIGSTGGASTTSNVGAYSSMMTFKQYLTTQEDSISDEEAIQKYQDYKLDFKRQQLHSFFVAHKDEEWFRLKYHPEDSSKQKLEQQTSVHRRAEVFQELLDKGWMEKGVMDHTNGRYLIKLMDAVVVKLENGTDEDLTTLDKMDEMDEINNEIIRRNEKDKDEPMPSAPRQTRVETVESTETFKRKRSSGGANEEGALSDSDADDDDKGSVASEKSKSSAPPSVEAGEVAADRDSPTPTPTKIEAEEPIASPTGEITKKESPSPRQSPPPPKMMLHKTASIFLRNLAPTITRGEVEALCKRFPGFLRVALAEPIPDRKFYRRGWISFRRDVNIKEICWNLNNIRLKDCDMGPIVNRDLTRRIRTVNGITVHKQTAQNDLRLASRLVQIYDQKYNLFGNEAAANGNGKSFGDDAFLGDFNVSSKNPLLKNITDFLIEEASAEEEELLGTSSKVNEDDEQKVPLERDENVLKYPNEDEMPNRCGLVHVRGPPISPAQFGQDDKGNTLLPMSFINDFCKNFESRLQPLLSTKEKITEDEADKLGKKDAEKEVEAFINANCQELAQDKWLCPLSGKKFKGPEFVRKHITNKHNEKLDEVRLEVLYFNNFLYDPKRPGVVDAKPAQFGPMNYAAAPLPSLAGHDRGYVQHDRGGPMQDHYRMGYSGGGGYYRSDNYGGGSGGYSGGGGYRRDHYQRRDYGGQRNYGSSGSNAGGGGGGSSARQHPAATESRRDPRVPVAYIDLDAPEDVY